MVCAKRPLKWHEIQGAVSIDPEDQSIAFDERKLRRHIHDLCGSLIQALPGDRVEFVHNTAKEYVMGVTSLGSSCTTDEVIVIILEPAMCVHRQSNAT